MLGMRALYHQAGWLAACTSQLSGWGGFDKDQWELYDLGADRILTTTWRPAPELTSRD